MAGGINSGRALSRRDVPKALEALVISRIEERDGHWIWTGCITGGNTGYRVPCLNTKRFAKFGTITSAARLTYILHVGSIRKGQTVFRTCGEMLCVNPEHLQAGSAGDMLATVQALGRNPRNASLETVAEIRRRYQAGEQPQQIADALGRSASAVRVIARNRKFIDPTYIPRASIASRAAAKLTEDDVLRLRQRHLVGISVGQVAKECGLRENSVSEMLHGVSWPHVGSICTAEHVRSQPRGSVSKTPSGRYQAQVCRKYLGLFDTEKEARMACDLALNEVLTERIKENQQDPSRLVRRS